MATDPEPAEAMVSALSADAYCPNCGYNLRGLSGDPIRCPECGGRYARTELRWPAVPRVMPREERARRYLRASADLCALATAPGLLGAWALVAGDQGDRQFFLPLATTSGIAWLIGFALFAWRCLELPGWPGALVVYQFAAVPAMCVNLVLSLVVSVLISVPCVGIGVTLPLILAVVAVASMAVRFDPMFWLKRLGAKRLDALAEQLAQRIPTPAASDQTPPT